MVKTLFSVGSERRPSVLGEEQPEPGVLAHQRKGPEVLVDGALLHPLQAEQQHEAAARQKPDPGPPVLGRLR